MGRIACIFVSDFPVAAQIRANPALDESPLGIAQSTAPHCELLFISQRARAMGVRAGMTIAQARAISSELAVMVRSDAAEQSAQNALADAATSVSPVVEPGAPGVVWLDIAGLGRVFGNEEEIASELIRRVRRVGMEASVGVAANKEIAHLAARCGGRRIIAPGLEREFLDWLPLDVLDLGTPGRAQELELTLERWGIRRLGDLARLDPAAVGSRLGRRGVELVRIARGDEFAPLAQRPQAETFAEETELDYGVENLEALGFIMRAMLDRLIERLEMRGLVAGGVVLGLALADHRRDARRVVVAAPSNDVRALLTLVMLAFENAPPDAPIEAVRIEIEPRAPRPAQADMFLAPMPAPQRLEATIARLAALAGPDSVGMLTPANSHRPEAVRIERFAPAAGPLPNPLPGQGEEKNVARLVMRAVRPAMEVEVLCGRGEPEFVRGRNLGARVVTMAGPWRREGEWWKRTSAAPGDGHLTSPTAPANGGTSQRDSSLHIQPTAWNAARCVPDDLVALNGGAREYRFFPRPGSDAERAMPFPLGEIVVGEGDAVDSRAAKIRRSGQGEGAQGTEGRIDPHPHPLPSECTGEGLAGRERSWAGFVRDYYEFALDDGGVYRVFHDLRADKWFVDGVYD